LNSNES
jgi:hypothetical protein